MIRVPEELGNSQVQPLDDLEVLMDSCGFAGYLSGRRV